MLRCVSVPSGLQLASPMSRVVEEFSGSQARAEVAAWAVWDPILVNHMLCEVRGVTRLREPGVYLVRDPKAVGGAGRGGSPPPPPRARLRHSFSHHARVVQQATAPTDREALRAAACSTAGAASLVTGTRKYIRAWVPRNTRCTGRRATSPPSTRHRRRDRLARCAAVATA